MLLGGIAIVAVGLAIGEGGDVDVDAFSTRSILALAYLIVFGSWVAYTAYAWLLQNAPISKVSTYAYVNPVVAIALGWLVLDEVVTSTTIVGATIIVASVALVVRTESARRARPAAAAPSARRANVGRVSLTAGSGPLGERPAGRFDQPVPERVLFIEGVPARIRGIASGETVVDSPNALLLHETGRLPVYHFPAAEVRTDLLAETGEREPSAPRRAGLARAARSATAACRARPGRYPEPAADFLEGLLAFRWDALDEWFAEAEQLFGHPKDPYSRIDVCRTTRHVRVLLDGEVLADSRRARVLYEAALPPRWYLPAEDVDTDRLVAERQPDPLRVQGRGVLLARPRRRPAGRGPRLELPGPRARRRARARHALLLLREGRHRARRGGRGAADDAVVAVGRLGRRRVARAHGPPRRLAPAGSRQRRLGRGVRSAASAPVSLERLVLQAEPELSTARARSRRCGRLPHLPTQPQFRALAGGQGDERVRGRPGVRRGERRRRRCRSGRRPGGSTGPAP